MTLEEKVNRLETLSASLAVNLAIVVDRLNGVSKVNINSLIKSIERDKNIALEILGVN